MYIFDFVIGFFNIFHSDHGKKVVDLNSVWEQNLP